MTLGAAGGPPTGWDPEGRCQHLNLSAWESPALPSRPGMLYIYTRLRERLARIRAAGLGVFSHSSAENMRNYRVCEHRVCEHKKPVVFRS